MKKMLVLFLIVAAVFVTYAYAKTYVEEPGSTVGLVIACGKQADGTVTPMLVAADGTAEVS